MGVIYEVNLEADAAIADELRQWLRGHVREMLALPGFTGAGIHEVLDPPASAGSVSLCVQYAMRDGEAFDAYLREHAPRMRAEGSARFGTRMRASRRLLRPLHDPA